MSSESLRWYRLELNLINRPKTAYVLASYTLRGDKIWVAMIYHLKTHFLRSYAPIYAARIWDSASGWKEVTTETVESYHFPPGIEEIISPGTRHLLPLMEYI